MMFIRRGPCFTLKLNLNGANLSQSERSLQIKAAKTNKAQLPIGLPVLDGIARGALKVEGAHTVCMFKTD